MNAGGSGRRLAAGLAASAAIAAAAAGWYNFAATPPEEARPSDQQEATEHGLPALARFKVASRRPDGTFPPSLYGWAAGVHSRVSGALEDVSDDCASSENAATRTVSTAAHPSTSGRRTAFQFAAEHQQEVAVLNDLVNKQGLRNLPERLQNDAELIRYAIAAGLFRAESAQERESAFHRAAASVAATAKWLQDHHFFTPEEMQPYRNLVWWEDWDPNNRPILMVRLGRALNECKGRAEADTVAEVIVSQINRGVLTYLSNNEQGPEKLVVILDCRGATAMQVSHLLHQVV
ncbi:hypothetical protein ABBQ32_006642 [Trebouxia sp. C0010 RCD-2024]